MKEDIFQKLKLGVFVIAGTILFIISMYFIGDKQNLFGSTIKLRAIFKNINGLQQGNNVRFLGIDVGTVKNIEILNDTSIMVIMIIEEEIIGFIKKDAVSIIGTDGLMGNKLINITPKYITSEVVKENDTLNTLSELDTEEMLRKLEHTNSNVAMITYNLVDITKEIQAGKGTIGRLLKDTTLAQNIDETLINLKKSSKKTTRILEVIEDNIKDINLGEGTVGSLFVDTIFAKNIKEMIEELKVTSSNTKEITAEIKRMVSNVKNGQGAFGNVIADSTFSENLERSIDNIQKGTEAFNENMEALKHNFLFRGYFKKQDKKKKSND
jgi:phospholipid/cholesterol/gamma-HCH transport system substrate-binding protein